MTTPTAYMIYVNDTCITRARETLPHLFSVDFEIPFLSTHARQTRYRIPYEYVTEEDFNVMMLGFTIDEITWISYPTPINRRVKEI